MEENRGHFSNVLIVILCVLSAFSIYCSYRIWNEVESLSTAVAAIEQDVIDRLDDGSQQQSVSSPAVSADKPAPAVSADKPAPVVSAKKSIPIVYADAPAPVVPVDEPAPVEDPFAVATRSAVQKIFNGLGVETRSDVRQTGLPSFRPDVKVRVEDHYMMLDPEFPDVSFPKDELVVIDIIVNQLGIVVRAIINDGTTVRDEDVLYACKEAALKLLFSYNPDAPDRTAGKVIYSYVEE